MWGRGTDLGFWVVMLMGEGFGRFDDCGDLIEQGDVDGVRAMFSGAHEAEVAEKLSWMDERQVWYVLGVLDGEDAADVFGYFDVELQVRLASGAHRQMMAKLLEAMDHDDRVDLVQRLDAKVRERLLPLVARADREDIRRLATYERGTSGAIMSSDYAMVRPSMTAGDAIEKLREEAPDKETIYYVYVVDEARKLIGFVALKDLILGRPNQRIDELMKGDVISVNLKTDQEETVGLIEKYDLIALPVVDDAGMLVGIVTYDDAMDVMRQEQTEDMEKFMAIGGGHELSTYLKTGSVQHFNKRVYWIVALAALELVSGVVIHHFEGTLATLVILALYMPMITDTGGNTGSQSATVVIRAMALGEVKADWWGMLRVFWKEFRVSVMMAVVLMVLSFGKVLFLSHSAVLPMGFSFWQIGVVISLALGMQAVSATMIGAMLPMLAAKAKLDPAVVASPALTTVVDITGLLIYFLTARMMLGV
ncbi:magnesium transporter [Poriferisphaera sp. WC338]|uniref:magnesium transporter n=1 Tax=Poriferisphaera sp. WC338 TaxID=3425129 RepID=UPI003D818E76